MLFQQRAKLAMEQLAKQSPVTLEQARAQAIRIKLRSQNKNKEHEIKNLLKIYNPKWAQKQIEIEYHRLMTANKNDDGNREACSG